MKKLLGPLAAAAIVGLALTDLPARSPVTVEPGRYEIDLENEQVRVLRITQAPHEKGEMHSHPASVIVMLTDAHFRFTYPDGRTEEVSAKAGQTRWAGPVTHQVENLADTASVVLHVEVKRGEPKDGVLR